MNNLNCNVQETHDYLKFINTQLNMCRCLVNTEFNYI